MKTLITLSEDKERLRVASAYNPVFVERFRQIDGRRFDGATKDWVFPATKDALMAICDVAGVLPFMLPNDLQEILRDDTYTPAKQTPADVSIINGHSFLTKPFDHQRKNLARLLTSPRWLISDEMGTGKSHAVCNRIKHDYFDDESDLQVLILCPKSVVTGWCEELMRHAGIFSEIVQGNAKQRAQALTPGGVPIKIANYELLLHSDFNVVDWDIVVLDEVHRVKNFTAQTSRKVRELTRKSRFTWGLSGTPAPNGLEDWLGVLAAIDPDLLPTKTKTAFEARYCVKREIQQNVWKVCGYKNVQELHGYIQSITSRVTKEEVLDLPPKTYLPRRCDLGGEQLRVYKEIKKDAVATLKTLKASGELTVRNVLTEGMRLLQIIGGFLASDDGEVVEFEHKAKLGLLEEALEDLGSRQAVIWCAFRPEVNMIERWLQANGYSVTTLMGGMSGNERSENLEAFKRKDVQFFTGTSAAGGTGINQLVGADTCIYYSRDFSLPNYLQSQDRCHRIGTVSPVTIVKLLAENTIDIKIDQALDQKRNVLEMMLSNPSEML